MKIYKLGKSGTRNAGKLIWLLNQLALRNNVVYLTPENVPVNWNKLINVGSIFNIAETTKVLFNSL